MDENKLNNVYFLMLFIYRSGCPSVAR